jgi:glycosyltransferase involved in cell wall biosynthesis
MTAIPTPTPIVTVVMPTFDRLHYVREAISSVYAQTLEAWELIVVDDGSGEPTRHYLASPPDSRMSVLFHSHTGKPSVARNRGIEHAHGRYVAFLDSDDRWAPDKLQRQLELMASSPARRGSYTAVRRIDGDGHEIHARSVPWVAHSGSVIEQVLRVDAQIATPTVMAELEFVRELGGFDESMRFVEDYDLWSRMALRSEVAVDAAPLTDVRSHEHHFTSDRIGNLAGWASLYAKMEEHVGTPRLRTLCRERKRDYLLMLAAAQGRAGDWSGLRRTAAAAARAFALSPRGWLRIAHSAALAGLRELSIAEAKSDRR